MKIREILRHTPSRIAAVWALDCAEHALPKWMIRHPDDERPHRAIEIARKYLNGTATRADIDAVKGRDTGAIFVARAVRSTDDADQVVEAAWDAAWYVTRDARPKICAFETERQWQLEHLLELLREE